MRSASGPKLRLSTEPLEGFQSTTITFGGISGACSVLPATSDSGNLTTIRTDLRVPSSISVHPLSLRFYQLLGELAAVHAAKQLDYGRQSDPFANVRGSEEWGVRPWIGALLRGNDKVKRLQKFATAGELANESVIDSFKDLAVYAIIGLVLYEEETLKKGAV